MNLNTQVVEPNQVSNMIIMTDLQHEIRSYCANHLLLFFHIWLCLTTLVAILSN